MYTWPSGIRSSVWQKNATIQSTSIVCNNTVILRFSTHHGCMIKDCIPGAFQVLRKKHLLLSWDSNPQPLHSRADVITTRPLSVPGDKSQIQISLNFKTLIQIPPKQCEKTNHPLPCIVQYSRLKVHYNFQNLVWVFHSFELFSILNSYMYWKQIKFICKNNNMDLLLTL